jgi:hypothetical protein
VTWKGLSGQDFRDFELYAVFIEKKVERGVLSVSKQAFKCDL